MQREGLIAFALLLTLSVLAPQGDRQSEAAAQTEPPAALEFTPAGDTMPAMTLTGPLTGDEHCELDRGPDADNTSDVHLKLQVNVSI